VVELRKSGARHQGAEQTTVGDPPAILTLLFMMMIMTTGVRQDWSDLLRAAYNRKCATGCAFEVVLIIAACTCLKIEGIIGIETEWKYNILEISSAGISYFCQPRNRFVTSILVGLPFL